MPDLPPPNRIPRSTRSALVATVATVALVISTVGHSPADAATSDVGVGDEVAYPIKADIEPALTEYPSYYRFAVARLYLAYFNRVPETGGWLAWNGRHIMGGQDLDSISDRFSSSPEFINRYGHLTNREFVERVYMNVMARKPDQRGLDAWTARLDQGMSRGAVMTRFSESPEFTNGRGIQMLLGLSAKPVDVDSAYEAAFARSAGVNCHQSYSGCLAPGTDDVDCAGGSGDGPRYVSGPVWITGPDDYNLDHDGDGVACEPTRR